ncbi:MAG: hypothetical protein JO352_36290 [Chloroflexi bacterium]|nr:hypothetical protein [Chloroflexota bacterium]MBV9602280.1 hypothetical protein [Chloroflexota bacterium]
MTRSRPFGVTLLAILAAIAGLIAAYHTFQYLHILPFFMGPVAFYGFDLLGALLWAITTIVYAWVVSMLWTMNPSGWMFVVIISIVNLVLAVLDIIGASSLQAELPALIINAVVLLYCLLPSTKRAFGAPIAA